VKTIVEEDRRVVVGWADEVRRSRAEEQGEEDRDVEKLPVEE
jgi:hypothetical protein